MENRSPLAFLAGLAPLLVVAGLVLVLLGPAIVWNRQASFRGLQAQLNNLTEMKQIELNLFRKDQDKERKAAEEAEKTMKKKDEDALKEFGDKIDPADATKYEKVQAKQRELEAAAAKRTEDMSLKEEKWSKDLEAKNEELTKKYDEDTLKRQMLNEQAALVGSSVEIWLSFLGKLLMLVGLLVLTLDSDGLKQKVLLAILLLTMLTMIPGPNLSLRANLGGETYSAGSK